ncbi:MAG: polymer-forming cytoskeletal protein [Gemmatimonadota bacterium]
MAIFKKNEAPSQSPRDRATTTQQRSPSGDAAISIIGVGMKVVGDIGTEGIVRIEGEVRGTVEAAKAVILGQGGVVDGNVVTDDAVIGGTVNGSITAANRLELQSTCTVTGEVRTRAEHLKLEEGARFAGQVHMTDEQATTSQPIPEGTAGAGGHDQSRQPRSDSRETSSDRPNPSRQPENASAKDNSGQNRDRNEAKQGQSSDDGEAKNSSEQKSDEPAEAEKKAAEAEVSS